MRLPGPSAAAGAALAASVALLTLALAPAAAHAVAAAASSTGLRVRGNELVDGAGDAVQLRGVVRSGTESACVQGTGIFVGPTGPASVAAIASWHANIVRIPINEDCWLGINGVAPTLSGGAYRGAVVAYVGALRRAGIDAEVVLDWAAPGDYEATYQPPAPDEDHAPAAWASMAAAFRGDPDVILSPWSETTVDWSCFMQTGCDDEATYGPSDQPYETASMQQAVDVMRAAGYHGVIAIPCIDDGNACGSLDGSDFDGSTWLKTAPQDPRHQLVAEADVFGGDLCDTVACLEADMAPIAKVVPLIFGEAGESLGGSDCSSGRISSFLTWADDHGVGYEAWAWDTWGTCASLISSYDGVPHGADGRYVQRHLAERFADAGRLSPAGT